VDFSSLTLDTTRGRLLARFGARVAPWWKSLPVAIAELAERWELVVGEAVGRGNTSLVVRCRRADGRPAVLKLTPEAELGAAEAAALRSWESSGQVPLVWGYDAALGALLLEAIPSEIPLSELGMAVELDEVASLIGRLHRSGAPLVGTGVESFAERVEFIFEHWIERHCRRGEVVTGAVPVERLRRATSSRGSLLPMLVYRCCSMGTCIRATCFMAARRAAWSPSTPVPAWERPLLTPWTGCSGRLDDPRAWEPRSHDLALALGVDHERLWAWCAAFAAMLAASKVARGGCRGDRRAPGARALMTW
jgi:streptomycin 6-kinase